MSIPSAPSALDDAAHQISPVQALSSHPSVEMKVISMEQDDSFPISLFRSPDSFTKISDSGLDAVDVPKRVLIKDQAGKYLTFVGNWGLKFEKTVPDKFCWFDVTQVQPTKFKLHSNVTGEPVHVFHGNGEAVIGMGNPPDMQEAFDFGIVHNSDDSLYLVVAGTSAPGNFNYTLTNRNGQVSLFFPSMGMWIQTWAVFTLPTDAHKFTIEEPIIQKDIYDVQYDLKGVMAIDNPPLVALSTTVRNDSSSVVTQSLGYSYAKSKSGTWSSKLGITIGAKVGFKVGVPLVMETTAEISISATAEHTFGGTTGTTETVTSTTVVTIAPKTRGRVQVLIKQGKLSVDFTYKERVRYLGGTTAITEKKGVYANVDSYGVDVVLDNLVPV